MPFTRGSAMRHMTRNRRPKVTTSQKIVDSNVPASNGGKDLPPSVSVPDCVPGCSFAAMVSNLVVSDLV